MTALKRKSFKSKYKEFDKLLPSSCQNCGSKDDLVIHHIVPLAKGGTNSITNMARLCGSCHALVHGQNVDIAKLTREGKERAKKNNPNYKEGRPKRKLTPKYIHAISLLENHSYNEVAKMTGISKSTLQRIKKQYNAENVSVWYNALEI